MYVFTQVFSSFHMFKLQYSLPPPNVIQVSLFAPTRLITASLVLWLSS